MWEAFGVPSTISGHNRRLGYVWGTVVAVLVLVVAVVVGLIGKQLFYAQPEPTSQPPQPPPNQPSDQPPPESSPANMVELSQDAEDHPAADAVRTLMQFHFNSINDGNFERWKTTVVAERAQQFTQAQWQDDYATTSDSAIRIHRIETTEDGSLRLFMTFTSKQEPENAPDGLSPCVRWRVVYPLIEESDQLVLDTNAYPRNSQYTRCTR